MYSVVITLFFPRLEENGSFVAMVNFAREEDALKHFSSEVNGAASVVEDSGGFKTVTMFDGGYRVKHIMILDKKIVHQ